jgi:hypothetical protein
MKTKFTLTFCITILLLFIKSISFADTIAIGYLKNNSDKNNLNFIQVIFSNSFVSSLKPYFDGDILKPSDINKILKKQGTKLKYNYKEHELPKLASTLDADFFIFGDFVPLANDQIKITINLYINDSKELFTFVDIGTMETKIFKLVDRITRIFNNILNKDLFYKKSIIQNNSNLAFITNISGHELNEFYLPFLQKRYFISYVQSCSLKTHYEDENFDKFKYIFMYPTGLRTIDDNKKIFFQYGTWQNNKNIDKINNSKNFLKLYHYNFEQTQNNSLIKLVNAFKNNIDYLFLIRFNSSRTNAWLRCINMKTKQIIWFQSNIKAKGKSDSDIENIANTMIKNFKRISSKKYK